MISVDIDQCLKVECVRKVAWKRYEGEHGVEFVTMRRMGLYGGDEGEIPISGARRSVMHGRYWSSAKGYRRIFILVDRLFVYNCHY